MKYRKEIIDFTAEIAQLLDSGLSMNDALETASELNRRHTKELNIPAIIYRKVKKGCTLSQAVSQMDNVFPETYRAIINLCDVSGHAGKIFLRLKAYLEKKEKNKNKLLGILIYPSIVLSIAIVCMFYLLIWILPRFKEIFHEFGGSAEKVMTENIEAFEKNLFTALLAIMILLLMFVMLHTLRKISLSVKKAFDKSVLKIPVLGKMIMNYEMMNFCFSMETMAESSLTIDGALKESRMLMANIFLRENIDGIINDINKGIPLSESFSLHRCFPAFISKWISIGERTGRSSDIFTQMRIYFEEEMNKTTAIMSSVAEPAITLLTGAIMIAIITRLIVPMMNLYGSIGL